MRPYVDRIFHKPIVYLGFTRQYFDSNWKLYTENIKGPYHASLLHVFFATFGIFRVGMKGRCIPDEGSRPAQRCLHGAGCRGRQYDGLQEPEDPLIRRQIPPGR